MFPQEKEGLITELRKELRVSDDEHRELLSTVNTDEVICTIREWRKAGETQTGMFGVSQPMHNMLSSPTFSESWKKQKTSQSGSLAFSRQMQGSFNQQAQPLTEASKWAPSFEARPVCYSYRIYVRGQKNRHYRLTYV